MYGGLATKPNRLGNLERPPQFARAGGGRLNHRLRLLFNRCSRFRGEAGHEEVTRLVKKGPGLGWAFSRLSTIVVTVVALASRTCAQGYPAAEAAGKMAVPDGLAVG